MHSILQTDDELKIHTRIVWLAYLSIVLSMVWGVPGLLLGLYVLRSAKGVDLATAAPKVRRDVRGGRIIALVGITLSAIVILLIIWSWITT